MRGGAGDQLQPLLTGQLGQRGVALVGQRLQGVGELDGDVVAAEPVDEVGQRAAGRIEGEGAEPAAGKAVRFQRLPDAALAAAGQDQPVVIGQLS